MMEKQQIEATMGWNILAPVSIHSEADQPLMFRLDDRWAVRSRTG
jgi:hypothetical protein